MWKVGVWRLEYGGLRLEGSIWMVKVCGWKVEYDGWRLEDGEWRVEYEGWRGWVAYRWWRLVGGVEYECWRVEGGLVNMNVKGGSQGEVGGWRVEYQ